MVLFLTLIVLVAVWGGCAKGFPLRLSLTIPKETMGRVFEKDFKSTDTNEIYDSYYAIDDRKDQELNVISQIQEVNSNKINYSHFYNINGEPYLLVKTMRHRNKRYTSYLTLCPFKICNMGRKRMRTRRYVEMIKTTDDDEET